MDYTEVMKKLETMGTAQNRKVYARHGVKEKMFGVSSANLGKLRKEIKIDHGLAVKLWASGNHDARILATMVAEPARIKSAELESWAKELGNYVVTDAFSGLTGKTAFARAKMERWVGSKKEWTGRAGWHLLTGLAMNDDELPDEFFEGYIEVIETKIHNSKNRVRDAMNNALIAIGIRNTRLEKKAVAAAKRIGKVEVDHGETGCKTPDAVAYIRKAKARKKGR